MSYFFMPLWFFRWGTIALFSVVWWRSPRTMYCLFWVFDLLVLAFAGISMAGFRGPLGILFLVEEVFVFIWHFSQFILFVDYYRGGEGIGKMGNGGVRFWAYLIFISSFFCIFIELAIWGIATFTKDGETEEDSEDFNLEESDGGLNNKIENYKTVKQGGESQLGQSKYGSKIANSKLLSQKDQQPVFDAEQGSGIQKQGQSPGQGQTPDQGQTPGQQTPGQQAPAQQQPAA